jgi:hypothetical protein
MTFDILRGKRNTRVYEHYATDYSFEFEDVTLSVNCLWRIVVEGRLALTSEDHEHQFGLPARVNAYSEAERLLAGPSVTAVCFREETADLTLAFDGGLLLEVLSDSSGYEPWEIRAPGVLFVARGGGGFADFREPT